MRLAGTLTSLLVVVALGAAVIGGCGGSGDDSTGGGSTAPAPGGAAPGSAESGGTSPTEGPAGAAVRECSEGGPRATGVSCEVANGVEADWRSAPGCAIVGGASHASCRVRGFLCIAAAVDRGTAVSCALPGRSIFFLEERRG